MKKIKIIALAGLLISTVAVLGGCGSETTTEQNKDVASVTTEQGETSKKDETSKEDENKSIDKVIYDKDGIKVSAKGLSKDIMGTKIKLAIENNSDKAVLIQNRDLSVNGIMMDGVFSANVEAGKKANDGISIFSSDLEENEIKDIKEVEFKLYIGSMNNLGSGSTTDTIKITF